MIALRCLIETQLTFMNRIRSSVLCRNLEGRRHPKKAQIEI